MKISPVNILLFVFIHSIVWVLLIIAPFLAFPLSLDIDTGKLALNILFVCFLAATFYLNYFFLIPRFLTRRKILLFILFALAICFLFAISLDSLIKIFLLDFRPEPNPIHNPEFAPTNKMEPNGLMKGIPFAIIIILSTGFRMTQEWLKSDTKEKELENDKLKSELAALKAQINPHFFFNVMNSLCSLARKKSDDTETYIIKLSELLRYNLNDLSPDKVLVSKELSFIKNYIDIQHLRIPSLEPVEIVVNGNADSVSIEPMLLFPFVENAFKHGGGVGQPLIVKLRLDVMDDSFLFLVENSVSPSRNSLIDPDSFGIGQQNIKRRLELLYKNKYILDIKNENNLYSVSLNLQLK